MMFWWILFALLAAEPANGKHESFPLEPGPLSPGLALAREPLALVLNRDGAPVDRLALPAKPKHSKRKDDHAVLALGVHGLWIVRLDPRGRLVVIARHRPARPVDGFFFEGDRVVPTFAGEPILKPPPPIQTTRPTHDQDVWPVAERLRALSPGVRSRMKSWPGPDDLGPPVSARPSLYLESSYFFSYFLPAWTRDLDIGNRMELTVLRVGFHMTPNHVVGIGLWGNFRQNQLDPVTTDKRYLLGDYYVTFPFYRYSMSSHRLEFQVEPFRAELIGSDPYNHLGGEYVYHTAWGVRLGAAWVKRAGPLRIGLEGRVDLLARLLLPSVSLIFGLNF